MRSLNDYAIALGSMALQTGDATSGIGIAFDRGTLLGFWVNFDVISDADQDLDLVLNGVEEADAVQIADGEAALTPLWVPYSGTASRDIFPGDRFFLKSNSDQTAASSCAVVAIIRR